MEKKAGVFVLILVASFLTFWMIPFIKEINVEELLIISVVLCPFACLTALASCKILGSSISKRIACLTVYAVFFVTTFFYMYIQKEFDEQNGEHESYTGISCAAIGCPAYPYR